MEDNKDFIIKTLERFEKDYNEKERENYEKGNERYSDLAMYKGYICSRIKRRIIRKNDDVFTAIAVLKRDYFKMIMKDISLKRDMSLKNCHIRLLDAVEIIERRLKNVLKRQPKTES